MHRLVPFLLVMAALGCHSASLRGPGPANPPAVGHPGSRAAELPAHRNHPTNYGWGSAYDPHASGGLAAPGGPSETGSIPPWFTTPFPGRPMGVPPKHPYDEKRPR